ncbi:hypothetical protein [Phenylobacterium sp.]|uniref:hypothetical protein n=1 Tax=Phenylobacterium sp. TaxID=1871053 RepID=UPI0035ADF704
MGPIEVKGIILGIAALGGVASLWIGYRLYFHGVIEKGKINLTAPGSAKITISDYGPGVAFWALGAFLLIFVVTRDFKTSTETTRKVGSSAATQPPSQAKAATPDAPQVVYEETTRSATAAAAGDATGQATGTTAAATDGPR